MAETRESQRAARIGDGEPGSLAPNLVIAKWLRRVAQSHQLVPISSLLALRIAAELDSPKHE